MMKEKGKRENVDEKKYKGTVGRDVSKVNELGSANKGIKDVLEGIRGGIQTMESGKGKGKRKMREN